MEGGGPGRQAASTQHKQSSGILLRIPTKATTAEMQHADIPCRALRPLFAGLAVAGGHTALWQSHHCDTMH
jgi:hypothetical protein